MKFKKFVIILPIISLLAIPCFMLAHRLYTKDMQTKMFTEIEEFSKLKAYENGKAELVDESSLSAYSVVDSYKSRVTYENSEYEVYAYVFEWPMDCYNYYAEITEQSPFDEYEKWNYCLCVGVDFPSGKYCDFVIYSDNRLYRILGKEKDGVIGLLNWLNSDFEIELK